MLLIRPLLRVEQSDTEDPTATEIKPRWPELEIKTENLVSKSEYSSYFVILMMSDLSNN